MLYNQFSTHSRKKQTKSIVYVWLFNKILPRPVLGGREWRERMRRLHFLHLLFFFCYIPTPLAPQRRREGKRQHCSLFKTAASMRCLVRYLSNNVNIVSPQLTILTFHSNHDFSNIKWNAHYSIHSLSIALGNALLQQFL